MNAATPDKAPETKPFNQRLYTFKTFLAALAITAALLWGGCCLLAGSVNGCDLSLCGNDFPQAIISPDGALQAVIFERGCGATTGYVTHVTVLQAGAALPNEEGNLFIADDYKFTTPESEWKGALASVAWTGPRSLRINYPSTLNVWQNKTAAEVSTGWFSKAIPVRAEYQVVTVKPRVEKRPAAKH